MYLHIFSSEPIACYLLKFDLSPRISDGQISNRIAVSDLKFLHLKIWIWTVSSD